MNRHLIVVAATFLAIPSFALAQTKELSADQLAKRYGCVDCHGWDIYKTGPSFQSIATKAKVDLTGYDFTFLSANTKAAIPENRKSTVVVARVGDETHIRIFDAEGQRVVDKAESNLIADENLTNLKALWDGNRLLDTQNIEANDQRNLVTAAAAAAGYTPQGYRERLLRVVKKGGKGNWTHISKGVPMPPFGGRMTDVEISRVVDWVLTGLTGQPLRLMSTGLGTGTVTSNPAGIDCGADCDEAYTPGQVVTLAATAAPGSVFVRWEGDATGSTNPTTVTMDSPRSVRAVFDLTTPIPKISTFTPEAIRDYLTANPTVNTPSRFLNALPDVFKQNWILMTRSESLQTGTAASPRILLPSADSKAVFTIGLTQDGSYPGSHPNAVEYMQWDAVEKNFRFHEIVLDAIPAMGNEIPNPAMPGSTMKTFPSRSRGLNFDDVKCSKCHSTRNVLNRSAFPGTSGVTPGTVKVKNKPNWDAYDSWGGMMPFNRDRIYQGSVEAAAFRSLLNLWNWRTNAPVREIIEQLELQPRFGTFQDGSIDPTPRTIPAQDMITRVVGGEHDGHIVFAFDTNPPVLTEPDPTGTDPSINTNYNFDGQIGSGPTSSVIRGGSNFVLLHHSSDVEGTGIGVEGRGVQLFDTLGGLDGNLNPLRIADEIISHRYATGGGDIDVRPVALAITRGLIRIDATSNTVVGTPSLAINLGFFDARNGLSINALKSDTESRAQSVPRRKADIQKFNLDRANDNYTVSPFMTNGLIMEFGSRTAAGLNTSLARLRQEVFRRPIDLGEGDSTVMGGIYVDRESYFQNTDKMALFRYFLEPLGVSVDKWSMGVRGRSRTYSFADVFGVYLNTFDAELSRSLQTEPFPGLTDLTNDAQIIAAVNASLASLPSINMVPTFTDLQRIFNKSCIECHGGLNYPPYSNFDSAGFVDFSEDESPPTGEDRLQRSHSIATMITNTTPAGSRLYRLITSTDERCTPTLAGMMPCGGPGLCKADTETIRRWIEGGRPYSFGDPHIRTIDGIDYDFQAAGEFVYLRGQNLELQVRQVGVSTQQPIGPNPHTGLTSCVSVNGAVALRVGRHRISYQPGANGMELRLNGELKTVTPEGIFLAEAGRIMPTAETAGIQIEITGGTLIVITTSFWDYFKLWYLNIDARNVRATEGLLGTIAPGNWLPAMPDGSWLGPQPVGLLERHKTLYEKFGKAWRVTDANSLFDYAAGTSTKSFTVENWPGFQAVKCEAPLVPGGPVVKPPQESIAFEKAQQLTQGIVDKDLARLATIDVMATGEAGFAKAYLRADTVRQHQPPTVPLLEGTNELATNLGFDAAPSLVWTKSRGIEGAKLDYKLYVWPVNQMLDQRNFVKISAKEAMENPRTISKLAPNIEANKSYYWKVVVEDGQGGVTESEIQRFKMR